MNRQLIALTADLEGEHISAAAEALHLLDVFSEWNCKATLFVVGKFAEKAPDLIREAVSRGHEIASHWSDHLFLDDIKPSEFRGELKDHKARLEDIAQQGILGFRAPYFSIGRRNGWMLKELAEAGFEFDASIYPGLNDRYGWPGAPTRPIRLAGTALTVFPVPLLHVKIPIAFSGGAYLRLLPRFLIARGIAREQRPAFPHMIYVHPWELFAPGESPRLFKAGAFRQALTNRFGRRHFRERLSWLLDRERHRLKPMGAVITTLPDPPTWSIN